MINETFLPNIDGVSNPCNCREKGITNKDFLSTFGKMIKNKTLKEVHNYYIEILGFDEKNTLFTAVAGIANTIDVWIKY
jgi:hypothetical protein